MTRETSEAEEKIRAEAKRRGQEISDYDMTELLERCMQSALYFLMYKQPTDFTEIIWEELDAMKEEEDE